MNALLFLARTGCQWRYLPDRYPPWPAVWQQWRRWRDGRAQVWRRAMALLGAEVRLNHGRQATPSMVMVDGQTVRRRTDVPQRRRPRGGRTIGAKRTILVEIMGLPAAARVDPARPHDVTAGRGLLADRLGDLPRVQAVVADRGYRGLAKLAARRQVRLDIKAPPKGSSGFVPIGPLWRVEHAFAQLGRWRRLSRCYEGTAESARAWLEVAAFGYLLGRL